MASKVRYEVATGKVNLITHRSKEIPAEGCKYKTVKGYPRFNDQTETLYVKGGRLIAIDDTQQPPLHRIIEE